MVGRDSTLVSLVCPPVLGYSEKYLPFLVLNFGFDVVNRVGRFHLEGDRLPRKGLDEDLHL